MSHKKTFFWASYADLMTSLFFVMLVLFAVTITMMARGKKIAEESLKKLQEIEHATQNIDPRYFAYNGTHKKHILTIPVHFRLNSADMLDIPLDTRNQLLAAGTSIKKFIKHTQAEHHEIQYLVIIEGQSSNFAGDNSYLNRRLSYDRALSLYYFWKGNGIDLEQFCEPLICGSGTKGRPRSNVESKNQRFLIHIVPKPGTIEHLKKENADQ